MVGGVLEANKRWDIGNEVTNLILKTYPGAFPIRPKVSLPFAVSIISSTHSYKTIPVNVISRRRRTIEFPLLMPSQIN